MYEPSYLAEHQCLIFTSHETKPKGLRLGLIRVFVCGALQNPHKMERILGRRAPFAPAFVRGFRRASEMIGGAAVPFMLPDDAPEAAIGGILWLDLTEGELKKIENLELKDDLRRRITVTARLGEAVLDAFSYVRK